MPLCILDGADLHEGADLHGDFLTYGLPNVWFACGSPFTKTTRTTKTTQTATNKDLTPGFAEKCENHRSDQNPRKSRVQTTGSPSNGLEIPEFRSGDTRKNGSCDVFYCVCLTNSVFKKTNVAQLVTIKNPNVAQVITPQAAHLNWWANFRL